MLEQAGIEKPSDLFGGVRGLIDSSVPPIAFIAVNAWKSLEAAIWTAVAAGAVLLVARLVRKGPVRHAISGFIGVLIAAGIAYWTGEARSFFLPGIVINAVYFAAFLVSVLVRYPLVGVLLRQFSDKPAAWHEHPAVRRAYVEVTLGWGLIFGLRVAVQIALYQLDKPGWLAATKIAMGWPLFLLALAGTMPWVTRRTRVVDVPDDPDADVEVAEAQPDDPAADRSAAPESR